MDERMKTAITNAARRLLEMKAKDSDIILSMQEMGMEDFQAEEFLQELKEKYGYDAPEKKAGVKTEKKAEKVEETQTPPETLQKPQSKHTRVKEIYTISPIGSRKKTAEDSHESTESAVMQKLKDLEQKIEILEMQGKSVSAQEGRMLAKIEDQIAQFEKETMKNYGDERKRMEELAEKIRKKSKAQ